MRLLHKKNKFKKDNSDNSVFSFHLHHMQAGMSETESLWLQGCSCHYKTFPLFPKICYHYCRFSVYAKSWMYLGRLGLVVWFRRCYLEVGKQADQSYLTITDNNLMVAITHQILLIPTPTKLKKLSASTTIQESKHIPQNVKLLKHIFLVNAK